MPSVVSMLMAGIAIGVATELIPGPLTVLVIVESLKKGWRAGTATAIAPIIVDAVVMIPLVLLLQRFINAPGTRIVFGFAGAAFLIYLGIDMLLAAWAPKNIDTASVHVVAPAISFRNAFIAHVLSPVAWGFWTTLGIFMINKGLREGGAASAAAFLAGLWAAILSVAAVFIIVATRGRNVLKTTGYRVVLTAGGVLMIGFAIYLAVRAVSG